MIAKLRTEAKHAFETNETNFKLLNNEVFGKTIENVRKHGDINLVQTNRRRNYLEWEPYYHTIKTFLECLLEVEMKKVQLKMNNPVYLALSVLEISKPLKYEFCMIILNQSISTMQKLHYMDTDSFIIHIKTENVYECIADDVKKGFDTSNYTINRPFPIGKKCDWIYERWIRWKNYDGIYCT